MMTGPSHARFITENHLDEFARTNAGTAQGVVVELIYRLIAASVPAPRERRFPLGDSINQHGPDGVLDCVTGFAPFVPDGRSFWEIGVGLDAQSKASKDYQDLTSATPENVRRQASFVFVTPHSGRRGWSHTWDTEGQLAWLERKNAERKWKRVLILDGTKLVDWLYHCPTVEMWLATQMGILHPHTTTPDLYWNDRRRIGEPPLLSPEVFLVGRDEARQKLKEVLSRSNLQLRLETYSPRETMDFVAAYIAALPEQERISILGHCVFILDEDAWTNGIHLPPPLVLVAGFLFEEEEQAGTALLQDARNRGHFVVYGGPPGGVPHPNRAPLPSPRQHQLQAALEKSGYTSERARTLAHKGAGSLPSLLRLLHHASLHPQWASTGAAAALVIAQFLGSWQEDRDSDRKAVELLAGKSYGEWIARIREIASRPDAPLSYRHGAWKIVPRYEAWHALAPRVFDELLERFHRVAAQVLGELDPALELPKGERYLAPLQGKILSHSPRIRKGLAETVAMLGALGDVLVACTPGRPTAVAALVVRELLKDRDWRSWASLDALLPLLAEGAPGEFLAALESALNSESSLIDALFAQETSDFGGHNYVSGLLWALETLAWEPSFLTRVTLALAQMASRDPGGNWANRPFNSLVTIYLPWLPQTSAPLDKKQTALTTLANELPDQAWKLVLALLPKGHGFSMGSHRPSWRSWIPQDYRDQITIEEYQQQISVYINLCLQLALAQDERLKELLAHLNELPREAIDRVIEHLAARGEELRDEARLELWSAVEDLISEHKRFRDAHWALPVEILDRLGTVAANLEPRSPALVYQRLFTEKDFNLFDENEDEGYESKSRRLAERRTYAALEVFQKLGLSAVLEMARRVESPSRLGYALGSGRIVELDGVLLPALIRSEESKVVQFLGGYVRGRFFDEQAGALWLDRLSLANWSPEDVARLLTWLPFREDVWTRADQLLADHADLYWKNTPASPYYELTDSLYIAIGRLLDHGRPFAAIRALNMLLHRNRKIDVALATRALLDAVRPHEEAGIPDAYTVSELIKHIREHGAEHRALVTIEWAYLGALDKHFGPGPVTLEKELSSNPSFFCDVLRLVFRSEHERDQPPKEASEQERNLATNAYRLLRTWHRSPGVRDNSVDEAELNGWLDEVFELCEQSGHLFIAQVYIGHVLAHSPSGSGGEWPVDSVARILNRQDVEKMRQGLTTELFNMRGVHAWDAGEGERRLAEKYHQQADAIEARGYHRVATAIRILGDHYLEDAKRAAAREFDE
jgi:hypothetical protein